MTRTYGECGHPLRERNFTDAIGGCRVCTLVNKEPDRYGQRDAYYWGGEDHWAGIDERQDAWAGWWVDGQFVQWKNHDEANDARDEPVERIIAHYIILDSALADAGYTVPPILRSDFNPEERACARPYLRGTLEAQIAVAAHARGDGAR